MDTGYITVVLSLLASAYATLAYYFGAKNGDASLLDRAEKATYLTAAFVTAASAILIYYFMTDNFSIEYVASYSSRALPGFYKFAAFWAGSDGSLLLWALLISAYTVSFLKLEKKDRLTAYAMATAMSIQTFFLLLLSTVSNPFQPLGFTPADGVGLNPLLQTPEMAVHPPTLFIGYAGAAVVFSLALAGVYLADEKWVFRARKWIVFTWIWLTQGIFWGAIWAYKVLGWGGYWAWDPVENSSLLPWLTLSALMHSVMIQEARRGMKLWNILLAFITFEFVLLGTFITRSGVISSVHAFGQSSLTLPFMLYMLGWLVLTIWVIMEKKGFIVSEDIIESFASKEATFLFNNLILVASALTIFWGTIFPLISEGLTGYKVTIGPPFYNQVETPLGLALVILVGFCIAVPWRRAYKDEMLRRLKFPAVVMFLGLVAGIIGNFGFAGTVAAGIFGFAFTAHLQQYLWDTRAFSQEYGTSSYFKIVLRRRRRYGGYTTHLGILILFLGIVGGAYDQEYKNVQLELNQPYQIEEYTFIYKGITAEDSRLKTTWRANIEVWKEGRLIGFMKPGIEKYKTGSGEEIRKVDILSEPFKDVYLIFMGADSNSVFMEIRINPLVNFVWLGSWIMTLGGIFALIPKSIVSRAVFREQEVRA